MSDAPSSRINAWSLGFLLNLGCSIAILLDSVLSGAGSFLPPFVRQNLPLLIGVSLTAAALTLLFNIKLARILLGLGLLSAVGLSLHSLMDNPSQAYLLVVGFACAASLLFSPNEFVAVTEVKPFRENRLLASLCLGTFFNWTLVFIFNFSRTDVSSYAVVASAVLCLWDLVQLLFRKKCWRESLILTVGFGFFGSALIVFGNFENWLEGLSFSSFVVAVLGLAYLTLRNRVRSYLGRVIETLFIHPEGAVIISFLSLSLVACLMLYSPASLARPVDFVDVIFTAVSAVCVTGLTPLDIGVDFTDFGRVLILIFVQLGGLGIMSLSSLAFYLLGNRLSLKQEKAFANVYGEKIKGKLRESLRSVLMVTFVIEGAGAVLLTGGFLWEGQSLGQALWGGIFTSISAFCNAGFALTAESFIPYVQNPFILTVCALLVALGGLSPGFILAARHGRDWKRLSVQHRIIALMTLLLLSVGTLFFLLIESDKIMSQLSWGDKIANAFFYSSISRTAGFNTFDLSMLHPATFVGLIFFMFIGGSPGGTSGGVKTTTLFVILATVASTIKGRTEVVIFNRRMDTLNIHRAFTVFFIATSIVGFACLSILATQNIPPLYGLVEVVSAFATVGLSTGVTHQLDAIGKIIIMVCMFVGRVGPLAVILYLVDHQSRPQASVPRADVVVT